MEAVLVGQARLNVAMVMGEMASGGVEEMVMNTLRHIFGQGFAFDLFYHRGSPLPQAQELNRLGVRAVPVPPYSRPLSYQKALYRHFSGGRYDIVHAHLGTMNGFSLAAARRAGVPVRICHSHSTAHRGEGVKTLAKYLLRPFAPRCATHLAACGEAAGRWLYGDGRFDAGRVKVLYNAIDFARYAYDETAARRLRGELGIGEACFVVGHIGRFMFQKNHRFLIEIFEALHRQRPASVLVLAGEGPLEEEAKALVRQKGLEGAVHFLGVRRDADKLYSMMDVFCLPSRYEGFPVVSVEACANGLGMLCSRNVTAEVERLGHVRRMALDDGAEAWAAALQSGGIRAGAKRPPPVDERLKSLFSAPQQAGRLAAWYREIAEPPGAVRTAR